jgi:putative copper resistance protein D
MMFLPILVVHWLHVLAGVVWFGGTVVFDFVLWPTLLRRPARESRSLYEALARPASMVFATAGQATLILGILRGTWLGQIRSLDVLTGTPYGHTFLTALILTVGFIAFGGVTRGKLPARVWNGDEYQPGAARFIRRSGVIQAVLIVLIVACMVAMHFGL